MLPEGFIQLRTGFLPEQRLFGTVMDRATRFHRRIRINMREHPDLQVAGLAEDGEQVIERCRELEPYVVLMDMDMPNKDGLVANRMIKQQWPGTRI